MRLLLDNGYRGHNAPPDYKFRVFISGQKLGVAPSIKRAMRRRSAIEPVIGHLKVEHRMERNYLWFKQGDAVLAAVGYASSGFCCTKSWPHSSPNSYSIQPENRNLQGRQFSFFLWT